jgi:hypothetical protein
VTIKSAATRLKLAQQSVFFLTTLQAGSSARFASFKSRQRSKTNYDRLTRIAESDEAATFNWGEFVFTFLTEATPACFVAPIIVFMVKGWEKGWNVCGHRTLLPLLRYQHKGKPSPSYKWAIGFYVFQLVQLIQSSSAFVTILLYVRAKFASEASTQKRAATTRAHHRGSPPSPPPRVQS